MQNKVEFVNVAYMEAKKQSGFCFLVIRLRSTVVAERCANEIKLWVAHC